MKRSLLAWILAVAVIAGGLLRSQDLLASYENGPRGACAALFALMAKNHLRHGLATTGGVAVLNTVWVEPQSFHYYTHHPQGSVLYATLGALLGGTNPGALRLAYLPLAIGIVLLVYRLGRRRSRFAGAAAASFAALMPLGVYYGAFVNYEVPTLFALLMSLHLGLRWLELGRAKDLRRAVLAQAAAVFCDWIALGLPLVLAALLPFRAPTPARPGRPPPRPWKLVGCLTLACAVVTVAILLHHRLQVGRYGAALDSGIAFLVQVTPLAPAFETGPFLTAIHAHLRTWVGLPFLLLAAAGLVLVVPRLLRRRLGAADLAALATLAFGVANVVILAVRATDHEYYVLYLLPAVALLAGLVLDALAGPAAGAGAAGAPLPDSLRRRAAVVALIGLAAFAAFRAVEEAEKRRHYDLSDFGKLIARETRLADEDDTPPVVLHPFSRRRGEFQVAVTADRHVDAAPSLVELERALRDARNFGLAGRPLVYLVPEGRQELVSPELRAWLDEKGVRRDGAECLIWDLGRVPSQ